MNNKRHFSNIYHALTNEKYTFISRNKKYLSAQKGSNKYLFAIQIKNLTNPNESKMTIIRYDRLEKLLTAAKENNQQPLYMLSLWMKERNIGYVAIIDAKNIRKDFVSKQNGYSFRFKDLNNNGKFAYTNIHEFYDKSPDTYRNIVEDINEIERDQTLSKTVKEQLIKARLGQGKFRKKLIALSNSRCQITGCKIEKLLIASHIKPWAASSNYERVDEYNGLLLSPNFDALFDKGFISFDDNGNMLVSKELTEKEKRIFGVSIKIQINLFKKNLEYLKFHRKNVFKN